MMRRRRVQSVQVLVVCALASSSFAVGFLAASAPRPAEPLALHNTPSTDNPAPPLRQHTATPVATRHDLQPGALLCSVGASAHGEVAAPHEYVSSATVTKVLAFPFEQVSAEWQDGPPDPNFLREVVDVEVNGSEQLRKKMLYTRNPLPWILKKTFIREEEFIFAEEERINLVERYSTSKCENKVLLNVGILQREAKMYKHPDNPEWTIFEQKMRANFTTIFGMHVKHTMERFAENLFVNSAKVNTGILENTLRERAAAQTAASSPSSAADSSESTPVQEVSQVETHGASSWYVFPAYFLKSWTWDVLWSWDGDSLVDAPTHADLIEVVMVEGEVEGGVEKKLPVKRKERLVQSLAVAGLALLLGGRGGWEQGALRSLGSKNHFLTSAVEKEGKERRDGQRGKEWEGRKLHQLQLPQHVLKPIVEAAHYHYNEMAAAAFVFPPRNSFSAEGTAAQLPLD